MRTSLHRLVTTLIACAALAGSGVFAASARSASSELLVHFLLPGGDTECLMVDPNLLIGNVTCGIHRHRVHCVYVTCDIESGYSRRWMVTVDQVAVVDRSRRPFSSAPARVLRPGRSLTVGYFRCTHRAAGLTCLSRRSGHGFFLSKDNTSQRLF